MMGSVKAIHLCGYIHQKWVVGATCDTTLRIKWKLSLKEKDNILIVFIMKESLFQLQQL